MDNICYCKKCNLALIIEEESFHNCRKIIDYKIEDNVLFVFDGERWYPKEKLEFIIKLDS